VTFNYVFVPIAYRTELRNCHNKESFEALSIFLTSTGPTGQKGQLELERQAEETFPSSVVLERKNGKERA